jgi:hypothetical protein
MKEYLISLVSEFAGYYFRIYVDAALYDCSSSISGWIW